MDTVPEPRRLRSYLRLNTIAKLHKSWIAYLSKSSPDEVEEPGSQGGSGYWSSGEFHYGEQPNQGAAPRSLGIKRAGPVKVNTPQPKPVTPQAEAVTPQANDPIHQATQRLAVNGIKVTDNMPEEYTPKQRAGAIDHVANAFDLIHKHIPGLIQAHQKQGTEVRFEGPQVNRNPDGTGDEIRGSYDEKSPHPLIRINNGSEQTLWHEATHLIDHVVKGRTGFASQDTSHPLNTLAEHLKQQTAHDQMLQRSPAAMRHLYGTGDASDKEWHDYYTDNREVLARFGNQYMNHLAGKAGMNLSEQSSAKEANEEQWSPEELEHYGKYMTEALGAEDFSKSFRAFLTLTKSQAVHNPGSHGSTHWYVDPQGKIVYGDKPAGQASRVARGTQAAEKPQEPQKSGEGPSVPKGPASPVGNPWVRSMALDYVKKHGIAQQLPDVPYAPLLPEARRKELADAYEATKHNPSDPAVRRSYVALALEVKAQYEHAVRSGMVFTPWGKNLDPYKTSADMREDVLKNKRLGFYQGGDMPADHPLAQVDPDHGLSYNDMFRAVHDLFGHAQGGYEFGARGEDNAWREHRRMFSEMARPALTNETRGQNHFVNNGTHLRRPDGSIPKKGEAGYIPPGERPFADQKAAVLPSWTEEE